MPPMSPFPLLAFFGWTPGFWEILVILVVAVLLFGRRLPELGRSLGRGLVEFKKGMHELQDEVQQAGDEESTRKDRAPQLTGGEDDNGSGKNA